MNYLKQMEEGWKFIKESKNYFAFVIALLIFGGVLGWIYSVQLGILIDPFLKELVDSLSGLNGFGLIVYILQNNLKVAFLGIVLGIVFGIMPIINSVANGLVIGYVLKVSVEKVSILEIWKLFPHGIFELPAIIIALGLGIKIGFSLFYRKDFSRNFYNSFNVLLYIVVPLLIVAAIIEGSLIYFIG
jgi:stage II sporulation protein M